MYTCVGIKGGRRRRGIDKFSYLIDVWEDCLFPTWVLHPRFIWLSLMIIWVPSYCFVYLVRTYTQS